MSIAIGLFLVIPGCLAVLVGWSSMRRLQRLRNHRVAVWAAIVPLPEPAGEREGHGRTLLRYTLEDGRIVERPQPGSARRGATLEPGRTVLIWYDPADPEDVLVFGRYGRLTDWAFVIGGLLLVLSGIIVAAVAK